MSHRRLFHVFFLLACILCSSGAALDKPVDDFANDERLKKLVEADQKKEEEARQDAQRAVDGGGSGTPEGILCFGGVVLLVYVVVFGGKSKR